MPWINLAPIPISWTLAEPKSDAKVFAFARQFLSPELSRAFHLKAREITLKPHREIFLGFS